MRIGNFCKLWTSISLSFESYSSVPVQEGEVVDTMHPVRHVVLRLGRKCIFGIELLYRCTLRCIFLGWSCENRVSRCIWLCARFTQFLPQK